MQKKAAKQQAAQQYSNDMEAAKLQRKWQLEDRAEERAYNRKELNETRQYSREALQYMVVDAERAGLNPLTVLRNGGASSYNAGASLGALTATPLSRTAPTRQAVGGSPVGDALVGFGRDFLSNFDPYADDRREQESRLIESQIASYNASALSYSNRATAPAVRSYGSTEYERRPSGKAAALGKPAKWEPGDVTVTNPFKDEEVSPRVSDAAVYEQRYGEPGSWLGGAWVGINDLWDYTARQLPKAWEAKPRYSKYLRRKGGGGW